MAEQKFEDALKKLEEIVTGLEQGKISLADSLKKYEEGIKLADLCGKKLAEAERRVAILTRDNSGKIKRKPFNTSKKRETGSVDMKDSGSSENLLF